MNQHDDEAPDSEDALFEDEVLTAGTGLSASTISELHLRTRLPVDEIWTLSKYFSQLQSAQDVIDLITSLTQVVGVVAAINKKHIQTFETSVRLLERWFLLDQRGAEIDQEIEAAAFSKLPQDLISKLNAAGFSCQEIPEVKATNGHKAVAVTTVFADRTDSVSFRAVSYEYCGKSKRFNMAGCLGLQSRILDFVPYYDTVYVPSFRFTDAQVRKIISCTQELGKALLTVLGDLGQQEVAMFEQEHRLKLDMFHLLEQLLDVGENSQYHEASAIVRRLTTQCAHAKALEADFLNYCFGMIDEIILSFLMPV